MCEGSCKGMQRSFDEYMEYILSLKEDLPEELFKFSSNIAHYELNHSDSLHDAWVVSLLVKENRNASRPFNCNLSLEINLLGQHHDRELILKYLNVSKYGFVGQRNELNANDTFHGDILSHEVGLKSGRFIHTIAMRSGSIFEVAFSGFTFEVQLNT